MAIKIIPDGPDITLTESEYARLQQEYNKSCAFMVNPPSFEEWVRFHGKQAHVTENAISSRRLLNEGFDNES